MMVTSRKRIFIVATIFLGVLHPESAMTQVSYEPFLERENTYNGILDETDFLIKEKIYTPKEKLTDIGCGTIAEKNISIEKKYSTENSLTESEENELVASIEAAVELDHALLKVKSAINASRKRRSEANYVQIDGRYVEITQTHKVKPLLCFHQIVFQHSTIRRTNIEIENPSWWVFGSPEIEDLENLEYLVDPHMSIEAYPTDSCSASCRPSEEYDQFRMRGEIIKSLSTRSNLPQIGGEGAQGDHVVVAIGRNDQKFYLPIYIMSDIDQDRTVQDLKNAKARPWIEVLAKTGSRDDGIRAAQRRLLELGHQVTVDGIAGPETARAIRGFQQSNALEVTGRLDPPTRNALFADG